MKFTFPSQNTPRYEFRCWRNDATEMLTTFREAFRDAGVEERIDIYMLPPGKPALLPKFRGGKSFEIKRKLDSPGTLELWEIAASEDFPLSAKTVSRLLFMLGEDRLKASPLQDSRAAMELFAPYYDAFCVPKLRRRFERDGCKAEITHVLISLKPFETIAFESENSAEIMENVNKFGLNDYDNCDYGSKLRSAALAS